MSLGICEHSTHDNTRIALGALLALTVKVNKGKDRIAEDVGLPASKHSRMISKFTPVV